MKTILTLGLISAALLTSTSAAAATLNLSSAEISDFESISNGFLYLYSAAGVVTHNGSTYNTSVSMNCTADTLKVTLFCSGTLDADGYTTNIAWSDDADADEPYYLATVANTTALQTVFDLWTSPITEHQTSGETYDSNGNVRDGNWIGTYYTTTVLGMVIYYWVPDSLASQVERWYTEFDPIFD